MIIDRDLLHFFMFNGRNFRLEFELKSCFFIRRGRRLKANAMPFYQN